MHAKYEVLTIRGAIDMTGLRELAFVCSGIRELLIKCTLIRTFSDFDGDGNNVIFVREYVKLRRF